MCDFTKRNVGNLAFTTLGVGIAIGTYGDSFVDLNQSEDLTLANRQVDQLVEQFQQDYHVYTVCISIGGSWGSFACGQEVRGNYSPVERKRMLTEFNEKLSSGRKEIFAGIDEDVIKEAAIKGFIRLVGVFSGLSLAAIGISGIAGNIAGLRAKEGK